LTRQDPAELERHINQLQTEKEQLMNKLSQLRARVKTEFSGVNFKDVLQATHKLRKEQEEEARLYQQTGEQKQRLQRAEQVERQTRAKLQALERSDIAKEDPAKVCIMKPFDRFLNPCSLRSFCHDCDKKFKKITRCRFCFCRARLIQNSD